MMRTLNDFVCEYSQSLESDVCARIIERFESDSEHQQQVFLAGHRSFTEINISVVPTWKDIHDLLVNKTIDMIPQYCKDLSLNLRQFPEQYGFEQIRLKRYRPQTDEEFQLHVDVGDHSSARRFLVCFWYLNTVDVGGETVFPDLSHDGSTRIVKPLQGTLLMFPPLWMFPHAGTKPISETKYIIGTYLHYV